MEEEIEEEEIQREAPCWNGIKKFKQEFIKHAGLAVSLVGLEQGFYIPAGQYKVSQTPPQTLSNISFSVRFFSQSVGQ